MIVLKDIETTRVLYRLQPSLGCKEGLHPSPEGLVSHWVDPGDCDTLPSRV